MSIFKCKMCGGDLEILENATVCECEYCGTKQTVPKLDNEKKLALFTRANNLRLKSEFDKAAGIYESIITEFRDEAEAYWGLVLCKYGIEYVEDSDGSRIPTCHRTLPVSIMDDDDFEQACEYADVTAKAVYRSEAKAIDKIQKKILKIAHNEAPYDIFICYKETDDSTGARTEDSLIAQDIYTKLIKDGYRVFFARDTLREVAGVDYEPHIYAALSSAKIMLAIGTKYEYYDAVWVKNEWSRFISMMGDDSKKILIPCFKNMDAYDMPKEFKNMQALDMGEVTFFGDLSDNIERIVGKKEKATSETIVLNSENTDFKPLLERGFLFLEDKKWQKADDFFEAVLNKDAKNAEAYLGKLLVDLEVSTVEGLQDFYTPFDDNDNYQKIMRFADTSLKDNIKKQNDIIIRRNEENRKRDIYEKALVMMGDDTNAKTLEAAGYLFLEIKDFNDSRDLAEACFEKAEVASKNTALAEAKQKIKQDKTESLIVAMEMLEDISGWKDADELIEICKIRIEELRLKAIEEKREQEQKAEEARKEAERKAEIARKEAEQRVKRNEKVAILVGSVICIIIAFVIILITVIIPNGKYNNAVALMDEGNIVEAYEALVALDGYKDSTDKANSIYDKYKVEKLKVAKAGDYVVFGAYEQDNNTSNGKEYIEWLVLEIRDGKALVISKYALDTKPYNESDANVTWETCTLRNWLNNDFINTAFSADEKDMIPTVTVSADKNPEYSTNPGNATQDQVFLLSITEVNKYFNSDSARQCDPTYYAVANGAWEIDSANCYWWLRSPGDYQSFAAYVEFDGYVCEYGEFVTGDFHAVRPALWIEIE